jgi:hypothetical protein
MHIWTLIFVVHVSRSYSQTVINYVGRFSVSAANLLWNNLLEPVANKSHPGTVNLPLTRFLCPTEEHHFIYTADNSVTWWRIPLRFPRVTSAALHVYNLCKYYTPYLANIICLLYWTVFKSMTRKKIRMLQPSQRASPNQAAQLRVQRRKFGRQSLAARLRFTHQIENATRELLTILKRQLYQFFSDVPTPKDYDDFVDSKYRNQSPSDASPYPRIMENSVPCAESIHK